MLRGVAHLSPASGALGYLLLQEVQDQILQGFCTKIASLESNRYSDRVTNARLPTQVPTPSPMLTLQGGNIVGASTSKAIGGGNSLPSYRKEVRVVSGSQRKRLDE